MSLHFFGNVQIWEIGERVNISNRTDKISLKCIVSHGPSIFYDDKCGFECYQVNILMGKNATIQFLPGYLLQLAGSINSFTFKNTRTDKLGWVTVLECNIKNIKVIGRARIDTNPYDHLARTGTNRKGVE